MSGDGEERSGDGVPLVVDLDGSLLRTDLLHESAVNAVARSPRAALAAVPALLRGDRAALKRRLAVAAPVDAETLPLRDEVVTYLREEKARGRRLVLATAADELLARPVAERVGLFDELLASDGRRNLGGEAKRAELVSRFGERGFDYVADRRADLPVFRSARKAVLVGPGIRLRAEVEAAGTPVAALLPDEDPRGRVLLPAIRARQWIKNLLVFVPLVTAHVLAPAPFGAAALAFAALSLLASAVYLLNDLADLPADRRHPAKRSRPIAAGRLPIRTAVALVPFLLAGATALALLLTPGAQLLLVVYLAATTFYSLLLKRKVLVDVFTLAFLYTLRVLLGGAATGVLVSPWLLAFSVFFFLSLAFVKRASELVLVRERGLGSAAGRDWRAIDSSTVPVLGATGGYLSAVVLAIYIHSDVTKRLYAHPGWLWLLVPILLYWVSRLWVLVGRGEMDDDPVLFAARDAVTWGLAVATAAALLLAALGPTGIPGLME